MPTDSVDIARRYVDLSNRHDLEAIGGLLAEDAVYHSARVGSFAGREAILEMMRGFFESHPDVRWEVEDYRPQPDGSVRFAYRIFGAAISGEGEETIRVSSPGRITEVMVGTSG